MTNLDSIDLATVTGGAVAKGVSPVVHGVVNQRASRFVGGGGTTGGGGATGTWPPVDRGSGGGGGGGGGGGW